MTKTWCDKCEAEIQKAELMGQLAYLERDISLENSNQPPKIKQINKVLCERCITKIRKHL